jgi:NhaA family Na+:H+ antiporter
MSKKMPSVQPTTQASPPEAWEPFLKLARLAAGPLERFLRIEAASGIVLLCAAAIAMVWANSEFSQSYFSLLHTQLGVSIGEFSFRRSLEWVVNDVLMVIFFFVVGLEIRREVDHGELSEWRRAALPAAAALGGMVAPAALYLVVANLPATRSGWGVPMATDIAFAVGILTLLGSRVPAALRVLLLALAVIDDLGAILVIALFYSSGVSLFGLGVAALGFAGLFTMQRFGVRMKLAYILPSAVAWAGVYGAGIHPTIAGVIVGLATPVRAWLGPESFVINARREVEELANENVSELSPHELAVRLHKIDVARREALSPAESLIEMLHPWVAYGIMPIFALANAGVVINGNSLGAPERMAALAVACGLVVGKPVGILLASFLTLRSGLGILPKGIDYRHLTVLGLVAGVGFTMALFIAQLAFTDPSLLGAAKLGVLTASGIAAALGLVLGRVLLEPTTNGECARNADEAERSTEK